MLQPEEEESQSGADADEVQDGDALADGSGDRASVKDYPPRKDVLAAFAGLVVRPSIRLGEEYSTTQTDAHTTLYTPLDEEKKVLYQNKVSANHRSWNQEI